MNCCQLLTIQNKKDLEKNIDHKVYSRGIQHCHVIAAAQSRPPDDESWIPEADTFYGDAA